MAYYSTGWAVVLLALAASSNAWAQSSDDRGGRDSDPAVYPQTEGDWERMSAMFERRIERAEARVALARERGDEDAQAEAEEELRVARRAQEAFVRSTTRRNSGMVAAGVTTMGIGAVAFLATVVVTFPRTEESAEQAQRRRTMTVGVGIGSALFVAGGLAATLVGVRRVWKGPRDSAASAGLVVGPSSVALRGDF